MAKAPMTPLDPNGIKAPGATMSGMGWLEDAEKRCSQASPAPWQMVSHWQIGFVEPENDIFPVTTIAGFGDRPVKEDLDFILAARSDLPKALALLREVDRILGLWELAGVMAGREDLAAAAERMRAAMAAVAKE